MSKLLQLYIGGGTAKWLQYYIGGVCPNDYNITRGRSLGTPKSDYVICARPLVGCCTYTIKQFYSFREKLYCIKLYYISFKSMCLVTILLVDAATLLCLEVMAAEETNEPHHLYHLQDHLRQLFQDLDSRSWACALLAIFLLSHQTVFHLIFSSETRKDFHKVFYNCLSIYVWEHTDWVCICPLTEVCVLLHTTFDDA